MDSETLKQVLKPRSGKSIKSLVDQILTLGIPESLFYLVLLSSVDLKFAVLMTNSEKEKFHIENGKVFLIRNLVYLEMKENIALFKVEEYSSFRHSLVKLGDVKKFKNDEINALKLIDANIFYASSIPQEVLPSEPSSNILGKNVLSLKSFLEMSPDKVKPNHFFEVNQFTSYFFLIFLSCLVCSSWISVSRKEISFPEKLFQNFRCMQVK